MTQRFPHDFWADDLPLQSGIRFDASMAQRFHPRGAYGFSRGTDWEALASDPEDEVINQFIDEAMLDEFDFGDEPVDEGPYAGIVNDLHPLAAPTGLFIPEKYEPNYPYPLVLWLHDAGKDESDLIPRMPMISERNYFGLSLRGPLSLAGGGFDWPSRPDSVSRFEKEIYHTLCQLRRNFHIHSERVFLAGEGSGATFALRLLLNRAEWFAGAFALGGELPEFESAGALHPEISERRVFLTTPSLDDQPQIRLWRAAGLNVEVETGGESKAATPQRLSQLNHWLMETICAPV